MSEITPQADAGGSGGDSLSRSDMVMLGKAIRDGYEITPALRAEAVSRARLMLASPNDRKAKRGIDVILAMDKVNIALAAIDAPVLHEHHHTGTVALEQRRTALLGILHSIQERDGGGTGPDPNAANGHGSNGSAGNGHATNGLLPPHANGEAGGSPGADG